MSDTGAFMKVLKRGNMFSKSDDRSLNQQAPQPLLTDQARDRHALRFTTVIGDDFILEGNISCTGEVYLYGVVRGEVRAQHLTIGETGHVDGSIIADTVEIHGRLTGTIFAKQVLLHSTSRVEGDITHEQLTLESGTFFQGKSIKN